MLNIYIHFVNEINFGNHLEIKYLVCLGNKYFNINGFLFFSMNIKCYVKNINNILVLLDSISNKFDVILLSKT